MIFLDTSYLVALANRRDQWHQRALSWSQVIDERLLTTEHVLWECVNFFSSPPDRAKAQAIAEYLRTDRSVEFVAASSELLDAGLKLHAARRDKAWSLTDCMSFHVMRQKGVTQALAADGDFVQAGFEALLLREPP